MEVMERSEAGRKMEAAAESSERKVGGAIPIAGTTCRFEREPMGCDGDRQHKLKKLRSLHGTQELAERLQERGSVVCASIDGSRREASEGEGACLPIFANRSHLPLRGKLGWMTPRSGVKTTPETERTLRGSRSQAGAPLFSLANARLRNFSKDLKATIGKFTRRVR